MVAEEAEAGTVISARLLEIADEIRQGTASASDGILQARGLTRENTRSIR